MNYSYRDYLKAWLRLTGGLHLAMIPMLIYIIYTREVKAFIVLFGTMILFSLGVPYYRYRSSVKGDRMREKRAGVHIKVTPEELEQINKLKTTTFRVHLLSAFGITVAPFPIGRPRLPDAEDPKKQKDREYKRDYRRTRYNNDPEFRERILKHSKKYEQKLRGSNRTVKGEKS